MKNIIPQVQIAAELLGITPKKIFTDDYDGSYKTHPDVIKCVDMVINAVNKSKTCQ